jgi:hypothetical protein
MLVYMCLTGERHCGTRTVAIIATFARLLLAMLKQLVRARDTKVGDDDAALLGGGDRWTKERCEGYGSKQRRCRATTLFRCCEMMRPFGSLDQVALGEAAVAAVPPHDHTALGMIMYREPRVMKV